MGARLVPTLPILPSQTISFRRTIPGYVLGRALSVLPQPAIDPSINARAGSAFQRHLAAMR
jgi:hypothetical protein